MKEFNLGPPSSIRENPEAELEPSLDMLVSHYRFQKPSLTFLQIGANDGVSGDPIYPLIEKYQLRGILVEPQPEAFANLKANYAQFDQKRFEFLNLAIASENGLRNLYRIRPDVRGPDWLHGIASFNRETLLSHTPYLPNIEEYVMSESVQCITFESLFDRLNVGGVDILQIDVEGYDAEILRLYDVPKRRPTIINFEHRHLRKSAYDGCLRMLIAQGYKLSSAGYDTLAYLFPNVANAPM